MKNKISPIPLTNVKIKDAFWTETIRLVQEVVIPYQWEALNDRILDAEPSYAIRNMKIAAGREKGAYQGVVFLDSDLAKWLEAVGYSLSTKPDMLLEADADALIDLIAQAQQEDGYLNSYYIVEKPGERWTNLHECHELYCAGHMIEAAVAYFEATGKRKFLDVMSRYADHIDSVFGPLEHQLKGYPGHQEIELALVKLYQATKEEKYLKLSKYFIDERGRQPYYFDSEWEKRGKISHWSNRISDAPSKSAAYNQAHLAVRKQEVAVGHAVRAVYMYSAMADLARAYKDETLFDACKKLWHNIIHKQLYITGGIGSSVQGEAFTFDYDLPNDTVYAETCASIGLVFFAHRMLQIDVKSEYADTIEKILYNIILASMSKEGKHFFYVNGLDIWPEASLKNPGRHHVKEERQAWFGCACCPPNLARLLTSLGHYIYSKDDTTLYTHLYMSGETSVRMDDELFSLKQETNYPNTGHVQFTIQTGIQKSFNLAFRKPNWCTTMVVSVNGELVDIEPLTKDGYIYIERQWTQGDTIELEMEMTARWIQAHPQVRANAGKVALQRGPLVYCLEEVDNGQNLSAIRVDTAAPLEMQLDAATNVPWIKTTGFRNNEKAWTQELYRAYSENEIPVELTAVPYYLWGNRGRGEMLVWLSC